MGIISREEARSCGLGRFFTGEPCRNGHTTERQTSNGVCLGCSRGNSQYRRDVHLTRCTKNPHDPINSVALARHMVYWARYRAKKRNHEMTITHEDLLPLPTHCPVLGHELVYHSRDRRKDASASIDRIDSTYGYVLGNVRIISWRANHLKSDGTLNEMKAVVADMEITRFEE